MTYDWKALAPARPLSVVDVAESDADPFRLYVRRADAGAAVIAPLLDAGLDQPIALFGPAGSGKSTELSALARELQRSSIVILARLDHLIVVDESTTERETLDAISRFAVDHATRRVGLVLPEQLTQYAQLAFLGANDVAHGEQLLRLALREIAAASAQRSVTLLLDGLERAPVALATRVLGTLAALRGEASIVVVAPVEVATGPAAIALRDYEVHAVGPVLVDPSLDEAAGHDGFDFLFEVAGRRLGVSATDVGKAAGDTTALAIRRAIGWSGGLVRTFLQLVQKGALYATMRGAAFPTATDVDLAAADQSRFLERLLREGDAEALRRAHDTHGREVDLERRLRLLASGLLLEYRVRGRTVVRVAPLLASLLSGAAA